MASLRLQSGKWQVRVIRKGHPPLSKTFTSKSDAVKWGRQAEAEIEKGNYSSRTEAENTLLSDALTRYLIESTPKKKGATVERYRIAVLQRSKLAKLSLAMIRSIHIATYRDERSATASPNTVKNELNTLSAVFETCRMEWGIHISNPVRGLKRPPSPNGRDRRLHAGEEKLLIDACANSRAWYLECAVILAIETGMRLGEISSLQHENIDILKQVAHLPNTKNGSARDVPLSSRAVNALKLMPRTFNGKVFPVNVDSIKSAFRAAVARGRKQYEDEHLGSGESLNIVRIDPVLMNLRFHDLRHEAVSRLFERGLNPMEVAAVSGHKTLAMLKRYTHLRAEDLALRLG